jgi:peptide deformylase
MIKQVVRDVIFLGQRSEEATKADLSVANDLRDTLSANREHCVGMAANMIGIRKRIIIANIGMGDIVMFNPVITKKDSPYETEEGCLSLTGTRKTTRYKNIEVEYVDQQWNRKKQKFSGFLAQIIQHECDHLEGVII